jgi:HEPN domain-containing protein
MADRDLSQCQTPNLSPDWQLNIAYNAALRAATAALAAAGYRAAREAHHYRVIQSLAYSIKADPVLIAQLDKFRKKRNISEYEDAGVVSEQEAKEMFVLAKKLRDEVEKWLRSNHPKLL